MSLSDHSAKRKAALAMLEQTNNAHIPGQRCADVAKQDAAIELRSDTFTLPTAEMLRAIMVAELGDDGYREDPTVLALEESAAAKLGKEAACLMPSGTMANLAVILAECLDSGGVVLLGDRSDIAVYEDKGLATRLGITYRLLPTQPDGSILTADLEAAFEDLQGSALPVRLCCLETPHNLCGGVVLSTSYLGQVAELVHAHGARMHIDGARIFNASIHLGIDPVEIVCKADSVQFCLSKGLAAPIGSLVLGDASVIRRVRQKRTMLGGDMRQSGVIAAAGRIALAQMIERLQEDHLHARSLALGLAALPGIELDLSTVQTNTVVFRLRDERFDCHSFVANVWQYGIHLSEFKYGRIRAVTHYGISQEHIQRVLEVFAEVLQQ